jgi:rhamnose utilization protein RhaD (predicted bifunctional aldolase and dehydrogenase)/NAD(P)-dependent dehydrogenase (short-subunit alcohol dehydrogenase family)
MRSRWNEAAAPAGALAQCAHAARLLGEEPALTLAGCGSVSVKVVEPDLWGADQAILHVSGRDADLAALTTADFTPLRFDEVGRLAQLPDLPAERLADELTVRVVAPGSPRPPLAALLHALLPAKLVFYLYPDALLSITNTPSAADHVRRLYGSTVAVLPYSRPGWPLAKALTGVPESKVDPDAAGLVLLGQGLVTFAETAQEAYERMIDLVSRAEEYLREQGAGPMAIPELPLVDTPRRQELASLRKAVSVAAGFPIIMATQGDGLSRHFARRDDLEEIAQRGPATPWHARMTKRLPLLGRDVTAFGAAYEEYVAGYAGGASPGGHDVAPRVILDPELGLCAIGRSAGTAARVAEVYRHTVEIILRAEALEGYRPASAAEVFAVEFGEPCGGERSPGSSPIFAGEVALVTGAASGIGRACIQSFLDRGAAAVGLDLNPDIVGMVDRPAYLGLCCDVTDEAAVRAALEATVRAFGGLDMLVLNAGVFPAGRRIDSLSMEEWDQVMRVNLDANLTLLREAHPLLKLAPAGGRVVINGSRNVLAPGPGAAAYSTSKAALTQLARVAALEWGQDNIRVNMIHAHAVFDTGIWTPEVLCARAEHYGLTVEAYKTKNVLCAEITSYDVAELVAEMCGPLFAKTTGAQVPIDGGCDRVI